MSAKPLSIALVDDHAILLDGIEAMLAVENKFHVAAKFLSGESLITSNQLNDIDLIVMDMNMKGKDGLETLKQIREMGYEGSCIFLSSYNDLKLVNEAMRLGASGYLTKTNASEYLDTAIETVAAGGEYYSPDIKDRIFRAFNNPKNGLGDDDQERAVIRQLTPREIEVLRFIAMQYTSEEIAKELFIAKSTVDTHRKNLIYKLKVKNAVGLGLFAERNKII